MLKWLRNRWEQKQRNQCNIGNGDEPETGSYEQSPTVIRADTNTNETDYRKHDRRYKDRQTFTNFLIAGFTAVAAGVGIWQGILSRQAVLNAEESRRTDQRAWISITEVEGFPEIGKRFSVSIILENAGRTPAVGVEVYFGYQLVPATERPSYKPVIIANQHSNAAMFPNSKRILSSSTASNAVQPMTEQDLQPVKNGEKTFYVFGECRYRDIFNRRHWTTFCYHLRYVNQGFGYVACREHNDIDGE